jgi:hypothetical protein
MTRRNIFSPALIKSAGITIHPEITSASHSIPNVPGYSVVPIDFAASGIAVAVLPSPAELVGKIVRVVLITDADDQTYTLQESDASTEIWTGVRAGDFVEITSDGATYRIINEFVTITGEVALSGDDSIPASTAEKIFDANYSVRDDDISWWDSVTNHRLDIGFDCLLHVQCQTIQGANVQVYPVVTGTDQTDPVGYTNADVTRGGFDGHLDLLSTDWVSVEAFNNNSSAAVSVLGDPAFDQSRFRWRVIKRRRKDTT